jgi:regulatory protein
MEKDESAEGLLEYALRLVRRSELTCGQLRKKLLARGASSRIAERICQEMRESGFIDDLRYCELFVSTHSEYGFKRMRMELLKRGIERNLVEDVVVFDQEDEIGKALELIRHWEPELEKEKVWGRLSRRGFTYSVIREALRRTCG